MCYKTMGIATKILLMDQKPTGHGVSMCLYNFQPCMFHRFSIMYQSEYFCIDLVVFSTVTINQCFPPVCLLQIPPIHLEVTPVPIPIFLKCSWFCNISCNIRNFIQEICTQLPFTKMSIQEKVSKIPSLIKHQISEVGFGWLKVQSQRLFSLVNCLWL